MRAAIAIVALAGSCHAEEPRPRPRSPSTIIAASVARADRAVHGATAADAQLASVRQRGHDALMRHCGSCHDGARASAKPAALAIFDLAPADWPRQFDEHELDAALKRFSGKPAEDKAAFAAFRDAELATKLTAELGPPR